MAADARRLGMARAQLRRGTSRNLPTSLPTTGASAMALDLPEIRMNRTLPRGARMAKKIPSDYSVDEENVVFGLGTANGAGGGTFTLSQNVPRSCLLRDLVIQSSSTGRVNSITINGKAHQIGGSVPLGIFSQLNDKRPEFSVWVEGGTVVSLSITTDAAYIVDAAFAID